MVRRTRPEDFTGKYILRLSTVEHRLGVGVEPRGDVTLLGESLEVDLVVDLVVVRDVDVVVRTGRARPSRPRWRRSRLCSI